MLTRSSEIRGSRELHENSIVLRVDETTKHIHIKTPGYVRKEEKTLVCSRHTSQSRVLKSLLCFMIVRKSFRLLLVKFMLIRIHREYYTVRGRYEFYIKFISSR